MREMNNKILPCFITGTVVRGFGRGSKALGIPTANFSENVVNSLPKNFDTGIYYGWSALDGKIYKMVASVGWNPFYKNEKKAFEVHILEMFPNDFYGKELKVIVTGYIRKERDFASIVLLF
ncbi:riboflavin kinase-like isoform X2 [Vespa mandarinia]|uniref:riboflavin kinase-like isoform X2 n=1 Tax=Vespa mandarinia TaxID=7446 RepID=UPI001610600B|nr:riboflavin kinase-like isoform X2 [Vespa mandarinia]